MHFVKINGSLSLSSEILNLYICWNIQDNTRIGCQRSVDLLGGGEVKAKQSAVVDYFQRNQMSCLSEILILFKSEHKFHVN